MFVHISSHIWVGDSGTEARNGFLTIFVPISIDYGFLPVKQFWKLGQNFKLLVVNVLCYTFLQVQSRVTVHFNFIAMHVAMGHLLWAKLREMRERTF